MSALLQPVILRVIAYALSSFALAIPASWVGLLIIDPEHYSVALSLDSLAGLITTSVLVSGGILAKWGFTVPAESVKAVVLRVILYALMPAIAAIPSKYASLIAFDPTTNMVTFSFASLVTMALFALVGSFAIFAKWGIKAPAVDPA